MKQKKILWETHLVADVETVNHIRGASFRATSGEEEEEEEEEEASEADTWAGKNGLENSRRRFLLPPVVAPSIYDRIFCDFLFLLFENIPEKSGEGDASLSKS